MKYGEPAEMRRPIAPRLTVRQWLRVEVMLVALETRLNYERRHRDPERAGRVLLTTKDKRLLRATRRAVVFAIAKAREL